MLPVITSTALWDTKYDINSPEPSEQVKFLPDMVKSLAIQSMPNLKVIYHVGDNLIPSVKSIFNTHAPHVDLTIVTLDEARWNNRMAAADRLLYIQQNYDPQTVVNMIDADDELSPNYISVMADLVNANADTFVVADLHSFMQGVEPTPYLSTRFNDGEAITFDKMLHGYCTGFSNTAFRLDMLEKSAFEYLGDPSSPQELDKALDWWVFMGMLGRGCKAQFTEKAVVNYRQHANNLSGITLDDHKTIERNVGIKSVFYNHLNTSGFSAEDRKRILELRPVFFDMTEQFKESRATLQAYVNTRDVPKPALWHENAPPYYPLG